MQNGIIKQIYKNMFDIFLSRFVPVWFQNLQKVPKFFFKEDGYQ